MNGTGDDELIQAKWSDSSDGGQEYHDHPQTHSQVRILVIEHLAANMCIANAFPVLLSQPLQSLPANVVARSHVCC